MCVDRLGGPGSSSHLVACYGGCAAESSLNAALSRRGAETAEQPALSAFRGVAASDKNRKDGYFPMRAGAETSVPRPGSANEPHAGFIVHKEHRLVVEPPRPTL